MLTRDSVIDPERVTEVAEHEPRTVRDHLHRLLIACTHEPLTVDAKPEISERKRAMREQFLPENDAPIEEREAWRRIVRAAAEKRFAERH